MKEHELATMFIGEIKTNLNEEYGLTKHTIEKEFGDFFEKIHNDFRKCTKKTPDHWSRILYQSFQDGGEWHNEINNI